MRLMVYLREETHKALRHVTIDEGISATRLVERLIEEYLAKRRKKGG